MSKPSDKYAGKWMDHHKEGGAHFKRHPREILRLRILLSILVLPQHSCWRRSNSTSRRLWTTLARNTFPKTYLLRITFMAMMNETEVTEKPHKKDDLRIQQAQEVRDHNTLPEKPWMYETWEAEHLSGNWDRKGS